RRAGRRIGRDRGRAVPQQCARHRKLGARCPWRRVGREREARTGLEAPVIRGVLTFGLTRRPLVLLGLLVFLGAGLFAFSKLNIEAYPNPAPVILEITAQAPGLSAEEMERYYTIPIEVGLASTPGV